MINLNPFELEQFKSLLSQKISSADKIRNLNILLRHPQFPDLLSNLTGLPIEKLKDSKAVIKYLSDPYNLNKIKLALRQEPSLSISQQGELEQALEQTPTTEIAIEQISSATQSEQSSLPQQTSSSTSGNMFGGMPSSGMSSSASGRVFVKESPPTSGKAGGTGQGTAATNKINRLNAASATNPGLKFQTNPINNAFKNLSSKIGTGLNNGINKAISSINNFGSAGGGGTGSRSIFGKVSRFGRGGGSGGIGSLATKAKKRGGLIFALGIIGFMMLVGMIVISGTPSTGEAVPITPPVGNVGIGNTAPITGSNLATVMKGQGRNTNIMGNEENFVSVIKTNGTKYRLDNKESYIKQVYETAVSKNVNPLAILVLWGTEQGFNLTSTEFSCPVRIVSSFNDQVQCAANTMNYWMNYFDNNKNSQGTITLPSNIPGNNCTFDDPFLFAMEKYGPVCTAYDSNDYFQLNFVKFYKELAGS